MAKQITIKSMRGVEMKATASVFEAKGWLYLNFEKNSKVCIDLATGEVIRAQTHCSPVFAPGELARVILPFQITYQYK